MKIGFYDSGLGGLSVLRESVLAYPEHDYVYWGDSARAPYGAKSPEQLKVFLKDALDYMQAKEVELVVSACNTTSMYIPDINIATYDFKIIDLHSVMKDFFAANQFDKVALLATEANINKARFEEWSVAVQAIKCPTLVPLVEALDFDAAKKEWQHYLSKVEDGIKNIVVGCTHYAFLLAESEDFQFIDPAHIALAAIGEFALHPATHVSSAHEACNIDFHFTANQERNIKAANELLFQSSIKR